MGGRGSGNWYRWDKKTTLEQVRRIDIRYLTKRRFLDGMKSGRLSWDCGGEPRGVVCFNHHEDVLTLRYHYRRYNVLWLCQNR